MPIVQNLIPYLKPRLIDAVVAALLHQSEREYAPPTHRALLRHPPSPTTTHPRAHPPARAPRNSGFGIGPDPDAPLYVIRLHRKGWTRPTNRFRARLEGLMLRNTRCARAPPLSTPPPARGVDPRHCSPVLRHAR